MFTSQNKLLVFTAIYLSIILYAVGNNVNAFLKIFSYNSIGILGIDFNDMPTVFSWGWPKRHFTLKAAPLPFYEIILKNGDYPSRTVAIFAILCAIHNSPHSVFTFPRPPQ